MKNYTTVAKMPSKSRAGKYYFISKDELGNLSCNCPSYIFKSNKTGDRSYKHLKEYLVKVFN